MRVSRRTISEARECYTIIVVDADDHEETLDRLPPVDSREEAIAAVQAAGYRVPELDGVGLLGAPGQQEPGEPPPVWIVPVETA